MTLVLLFVALAALACAAHQAITNWRSHDQARLDASFRAWLQRPLPTPTDTYKRALERAAHREEWGDDLMNPYEIDVSEIPNRRYANYLVGAYFRDQITTEQFIERLGEPSPAEQRERAGESYWSHRYGRGHRPPPPTPGGEYVARASARSATNPPPPKFVKMP